MFKHKLIETYNTFAGAVDANVICPICDHASTAAHWNRHTVEIITHVKGMIVLGGPKCVRDAWFECPQCRERCDAPDILNSNPQVMLCNFECINEADTPKPWKFPMRGECHD